MPWTVLIADDEPKIRRGLSGLLSAYSDEFTVIGEVEDGEKALEAVHALCPDVLLVDIRMPFLNGLDLVARLESRSGKTDHRIVIISGHDEFDYARKAVGLGVFDFLLKPVEEDVLLAVLRRAVEDLDASRRKEFFFTKAKQLAVKNRPLFLEGFFRDALKGGLTGPDWEQTSDFLDIHFLGTPQLALAVPVEVSGTETLWQMLALRRLADETFAGFSNLLVSWSEGEGLAVLTDQENEETWSEAQERLEFLAKENLGLTIAVERVSVPGFPLSLATIYEELLEHRREQSPHNTLSTLALNLLERRFREVDLYLDAVAEELQVSPSHLSRVLKQTTGMAFVDALARVRVRKACILLGDPSVKVYEVAERVGYSSQHYFSRAFRRVLGVAPSDYRKGSR